MRPISTAWLLLLGMCFASLLSAQSINFSSQSANLEVCGVADTFRVTLNNFSTDTLRNVEVILDNHVGINYVPGSLNGVGFAELDITDLDSVTLSSGDIPPFQVIDFYFLAQATCGSIDTAAISNSIIVTHNFGQDSTGSALYNLSIPSLSIQQITPASYTGAIGDVFNRCVTVVNGGYGPLSGFFVALEYDSTLLGYSNFTLAINNSPLAFSQTGDSILIQIGPAELALIGNGDGFLDQNEILEICYDVEITDCDGLAPQPHHTFWGCSGEICQTHSATSEITVPVAVPNLVTTRLYSRSTCYDNTSESVIKIVVTNTGSGPARDVNLDLWHGSILGPGNGYLSHFDTSRVLWKTAGGGTDTLNALNVQMGLSTGNYACKGPNPVRNFSVFFESIPAGEQDTLIVFQRACCKDWCATSPVSMQRTYFEMDYVDQCRSENYIVPSTAISGNNYGYVYNLSVLGPSDINPGDTATFCLTHSQNRFYNFRPGATAIADFVLPFNVSYTNLPGDFYFEDLQGDRWNPQSVTVIGDTVRGIFNLPTTGGFSMEKSNLKIRLIGDCSGGPCSAGPTTIEYSLSEIPDTSCSCKALLRCQSINFNVHCPGICPGTCVDGGLIFTNFEARRWNYGEPDNDNDGVADGFGTLDMSRVKTQHVMFGDTIYTRFSGVVDTTTANPFWDAGTATSTLPRGNTLTAISHEITIWDVSAGAYYTSPLAAPGISNAGIVRTFTYSWDTTSLAGVTPAGFVFDEGDSIFITAMYRHGSNLGSRVENASFTNTFELTNTAGGVTASCDNYSGNIIFVGYYFTSSGFNSRLLNGCNNLQIYENYYLSIGNCCSNYAGGNLFDYEYRHWAHLGQARVIIPPGYTYTTSTINFVRTAGSQATQVTTISISPVAINGDTLVFDTDVEFAANGGSFPMGDDGYYGTLRVNLIPGCQVEPNVNLYARYLWDFDPITQLTGTGSYPTLRIGRDSIKYQDPALALSAALQVVSGIDTSVTWEFLMQNNSNVASAANTWFALVSPTGQIAPYEVIDVATSLPMTSVGGIYQAGVLLADSSRSFQISSSYSNCSMDSLYVIVGWDCNGYPVNLASAVCDPDTFVLYLDPEPAEVQANLVLPPGPYDICDSILVEVQVASSQLAKVKDLLVGVRLPVGGGLSFVTGTGEMQYPSGSAFGAVPDPVGTPANRLWVINNINAEIAANNLPGIIQPDSNTFTLRFYLESNCDFISGDRFVVQVRGRRVCGDLLPLTTLISDPIDINGAVTAYSTQVVTGATVAAACPDRRSIRVAITNAGLGSTNATDSIFVAMPLFYGYDGGFTGIYNAPPVTNPLVQNLPGGVRLGWELPVGTAPGDSIVFDFDVIVGPEVSCGADIVNVQTVVNSNLFCAATGLNCNSTVSTGSQLINMVVDRPNLSFTTFNAALAPQAGGWDYFFTGQISNTGTDLLAGNTTTVLFYCDNDNNGVHSPGDNLIGNYSTTNGISSGSPHSMSGGFFLPNTNCNATTMIYGLILPDTSAGYCICDTVFANSNAILPVNWLEVAGEAVPEGNRVSWEISDLGGHDFFTVERLRNAVWETVSPPIYGARAHYEWVDVDFENREYYRILQVDLDGATDYSSVVEVIRPVGGESVALYPNPAREKIHIDFAEGAQLTVSNALGQKILLEELTSDQAEIETDSWKAGVYFFKFNHEGRMWVEKVVIE